MIISCSQQIEQEKAYLDKVKEEFEREKEIRENAERKVRIFRISCTRSFKFFVKFLPC